MDIVLAYFAWITLTARYLKRRDAQAGGPDYLAARDLMGVRFNLLCNVIPSLHADAIAAAAAAIVSASEDDESRAIRRERIARETAPIDGPGGRVFPLGYDPEAYDGTALCRWYAPWGSRPLDTLRAAGYRIEGYRPVPLPYDCSGRWTTHPMQVSLTSWGYLIEQYATQDI